MQKFHKEIKDQIQYEFTIYDKSDCPTKWYAGKRQYYTGLVYHVLVIDDDSMYIGMSLCSKKDVFNKKIGRAMAKGRAEKTLSGKFETLDLVAVTTPLGKQIQGFVGRA